MTGMYWDKNSQQWVSRPPAGGAAAPPPPPPPSQPPSYPPFPPPPPPGEPPLITTPRAPRPQRPPVTGKRRVLLVALAGALLGALAGGGGYLLTRHHDGGKPTGAATLPGTPTATAPGSASGTPSTPTPTATESPSPTATTPTPTPTPTGLHLNRVQDPNGFTLLVPDGWQRVEKNNSTFYQTADEHSLIQVFAMGDKSPYEEAAGTESTLAGDPNTYPGYRRIRLERTADGAAELEYAYNNLKTGTARRAVDRVIVGPNGVAYAVIVAGPEGDWPTLIQGLREAELTGFCFTAQCPAGAG
ncbi:hypothetical protein [Kitasatospora sp. NPDC097691]|uniref:hypothetical protein n=1 Tax=Kitasatospora sp. NPDC097691 TaxID=3157231 RepID=UPI00332C89E1